MATTQKARYLDAAKRSPTPCNPCVLLVDDHPIIRRAVRMLIQREWPNATCMEAGDEATAVQQFRESRVDLVLLDLMLGESSGLEFLKWALQMAPATRVLVFSMHEESLYAERCLRAGARGYIHKSAAPETLIAGIRGVLQGDIFASPQVAARILQHLGGHRDDSLCDVDALSDREMETFESIGAGLGSRQIAERLSVSIKTVEAYRQRIKWKLGITTGPELARRATEWVLTKA